MMKGFGAVSRTNREKQNERRKKQKQQKWPPNPKPPKIKCRPTADWTAGEGKAKLKRGMQKQRT